MSDDLDALRAALKAAPVPETDAKTQALALAMENFDRVQGSADPLRLDMDRPERAGFLTQVRKMLKTLTARPILTATTSALALMLGVVLVVPLTRMPLQQPLPQPQVSPLTETQAQLKPDVDLTKPATDSAVAEKPAAPEVSGALADAAPIKDEAAPMASADAVQAAPTARALAPAPLMKLAAPELPRLAPQDSEAYANAPQNPVHVTAEEPVSTFSTDIDTASYAVIRSSLNAGALPPVEAVRVEEMVNYFPYDLPQPVGDQAFSTSVSVMPTPWNPGTRLVSIALQGRSVTERPPLNLVFLIDTSGSMEDANKLPLLRQSLALMLPRLSPEDKVAIVTYAGSAGEVLPPTPASDRQTILAALDTLAAGGSTAGAEGLTLAYQVAEGMAEKGRVSRVLLATDGDFNVGIDDPEALKTFIAAKRDSGTYLSVLGFGRGNLDDATMQALAQNGNGTASYIDTLSEAQKVLGDQLTGALFSIANDVKVQVEWNPAQVAEYRLIGYETRALRREDFNNDKVDAGDIGAGLQVSALYEVTAPGSPAILNDAMRYAPAPQATGSGELGYLRLRYKEPGQSASKLIETPIAPDSPTTPEARFAAAIAGFGQLLEKSVYLKDWGYDQAIALATEAKGADPYGYRAEAVTLMRLAQSLTR